jgi:hypothetical protein
MINTVEDFLRNVTNPDQRNTILMSLTREQLGTLPQDLFNEVSQARHRISSAV